MTDRELLELAAKATDIGPLDFDYTERESHGMYFGPRLPMPQGVMMAAMWTYWRPLEDDGDALRLAVKVKRFPSLLSDKSGVMCGYETINSGNRSYHNPIVERFNDNPEAATRRAIVRAAAELGKRVQP